MLADVEEQRQRRRAGPPGEPVPILGSKRLLAASINLNQRIGNAAAASRFASWLRAEAIDLVLAQEPWRPAGRDAPAVGGFTLVGGDGHLATWIRDGIGHVTVSTPEPWVQRVEVDWLVAFQVHLDAYSREHRADQLGRLRSLALAESGRPLLVCGDFNIAPRDQDGLYGSDYSTYNTAVDRGPLADLVADCRLVDACAVDPSSFTFERLISGKRSRFRCDLALLSDYLVRSDHLMPSTTVRCDDAVRISTMAFTDHSAVLVDLPLTCVRAAPTECRPKNTAIVRAQESRAARFVTEHLVKRLGVRSVLDHGCGRGADVAYYRSRDLHADGYDPGFLRDWPRPVRRDYDLVTSVFVLNVLPDPWQRIQALQCAASHLRDGGGMLVVTRSPSTIVQRARDGDWPAHHDGYWSREDRGTFQRGISSEETIALARHIGLQPSASVPDVPSWPPDVCGALLMKPAT